MNNYVRVTKKHGESYLGWRVGSSSRVVPLSGIKSIRWTEKGVVVDTLTDQFVLNGDSALYAKLTAAYVSAGKRWTWLERVFIGCVVGLVLAAVYMYGSYAGAMRVVSVYQNAMSSFNPHSVEKQLKSHMAAPTIPPRALLPPSGSLPSPAPIDPSVSKLLPPVGQ